MTLKVDLTIAGLCLYAPDEQANVMHVLMPPTTHHGHHPPHHAVLAYDRAYEVPSSSELTGLVDHVLLNEHAVTIAAGAAGGPSASRSLDPETIVPLAPDVFFSGVNRQCIDPQTERDLVRARVELHAGAGTAFEVAPVRQCLDLPDVCADATKPKRRHQRMAEKVRWAIDDASPWAGPQAGSLDLAAFLKVVPLGGGAPIPLPHPVLYPVNGRIAFTLLHVVESLLPQNGQLPTPGPSTGSHFTAYYQLASRKTSTPLTPQPDASDKALMMVPSEYCAASQARFD